MDNPPRPPAELPADALRHLDSLWSGSLGAAYAAYHPPTPPFLALAAALVEISVELHGVGTPIPTEPARLLLGDLCLARASRLLAEAAEHRIQIGFARAIEAVTAAAAEQQPLPPLRPTLSRLLRETS
ncbi:MAG: hypothetical protein ACREN8_06925 [Candidatus Dormibacteraceae bacterium]